MKFQRKIFMKIRILITFECINTKKESRGDLFNKDFISILGT